MLKEKSYGKFGITIKLALANILLVTNAFVWYYYAVAVLQEIMRKMVSDFLTNLLMWGIHFSGITVSALIGASLAKKIGGRTRFLMIWIILGAMSPLTLTLADTADVTHLFTLGFIFGVSLGFGMPNCMGYYTSCTNVETRGRLGGIIILASGLGFFLLGIIAIESIILRVFILVVWRAFGLVSFLLIETHEEIKEKSEDIAYKVILSQRSFILHFIPWVMFSLVNYLITPVPSSILGISLAKSLVIIENGLIGVFAIVGGFLTDSIGRKRMAVIGFIMLGLSYSILGTYPENVLSWYFHTIFDGVAWGTLFVIFVLTIWGDLSYGAPSDRYYALGVLPFFISKFLQLTISEYIAAIVPPYAIFSFIAFFLFLAVIPLMYAPETLPEKKIRERELRQYIEKAKKVKEKYV